MAGVRRVGRITKGEQAHDDRATDRRQALHRVAKDGAPAKPGGSQRTKLEKPRKVPSSSQEAGADQSGRLARV